MQCPNCKSKIADYTCDRCGCDISILIEIKSYSNNLIKQAIFHIKEGKIDTAKFLLKKSITAYNNSFARKLNIFLNYQNLKYLNKEKSVKSMN